MFKINRKLIARRIVETLIHKPYQQLSGSVSDEEAIDDLLSLWETSNNLSTIKETFDSQGFVKRLQEEIEKYNRALERIDNDFGYLSGKQRDVLVYIFITESLDSMIIETEIPIPYNSLNIPGPIGNSGTVFQKGVDGLAKEVALNFDGEKIPLYACVLKEPKTQVVWE